MWIFIDKNFLPVSTILQTCNLNMSQIQKEKNGKEKTTIEAERKQKQYQQK